MKKIFNKIIAGISAVSILSTLSVSSFITSAIVEPTYDLNNEEYIAFINRNTSGKFELEDEIIEDRMQLFDTELYGKYALSPLYSDRLVHVYYDASCDETSYTDEQFKDYIYLYYEYEKPDGSRYFKRTQVITGQVDHHVVIPFLELYSVEEMDAFLSENNLKAHIEINSSAELILFAYDEDATKEDVLDVIRAFFKEYPEFQLRGVQQMTVSTSFSDTVFPAITIAGDVDMSGAIGIADIAKISKYTSNAELFPITDPTALANADVTQDGVIDSLDTNMLIEIALGTYESVD